MSQAKKQQDYKLKLLGINSPKDYKLAAVSEVISFNFWGSGLNGWTEKVKGHKAPMKTYVNILNRWETGRNNHWQNDILAWCCHKKMLEI